MRKIDEIKYGNINIIYYDGIDSKYVHEYKGDDHLIFFIKSWEDEVRISKRDCIIDNVINNEKCLLLDELSSNMISIYQTNGYLIEVFTSIKNKMKREYDNRMDSSWYPLDGRK